MDVLDADRKVAAELALEARTAPGGPRTWRRKASLLAAFGVDRDTDEARHRIGAALAAAGIEVHPRLELVGDREVVRLALHDMDTVWVQIAGGRRSRPVISATEWRSHGVVANLDLERPRSDEGTVWFDIDSDRATPERLLDDLWPFTRSELTREMAEDLLDADRRSGFRSYGADGRVRLMSIFGIETMERVSRASDSKAGALVGRRITLLVGSDWLMTCWHDDTTEGVLADSLARVHGRLEGARAMPTPGDLAINVVYGVTRGYPTTERRLHSWLDAWEAEFHERFTNADGSGLAGLEKATLIDLRRQLANFRGGLHAFEHPGLDPAEAWFAGVRDRETAMRVRELVSSTLTQLRELDASLRTLLDLLVTTSATEQQAAANAQAEQGERLGRQLTVISSVLIAPTLAVELYGAAPGDPGWLWFIPLVAALPAIGMLAYYLLKRQVMS